MSQHQNRRDFLRMGMVGGLLATAGLSAGAQQETGYLRLTEAPPEIPMKPMAVVRVGFVGVGGRGTGLLHTILNVPDVKVTAVCDIIPERAGRARRIVEQAVSPAPFCFCPGPV